MGIVSSYSGILLWALFLRLDSLRYPLKTYADIADRIYGRYARRAFNILQSMQLLISVCFFRRDILTELIIYPQVAGICLALGQSLSQITQGRVSEDY